MTSTKRTLLLHVLLLLLCLLQEAKSQQESRSRRQFIGDSNPAFSSDNRQPEALPASITLQECQEKPDIANAKVRCGYSGCRVKCDKDYKTPDGSGTTTLSCDHSSGTLTLDGAHWHSKDVTCLPYCGVDGCLNGGHCTEPRTCDCILGYTGENCEIAPANLTEPTPGGQDDPNACTDLDFKPQDAQVTREGQMLMVKCDPGYVFAIGRTIAYIHCRDGVWDYPKGAFGPGGGLVCHETQCDPPCQNGGTCLPEGVCDCPYKFWGGHCQHQRCGYPDPADMGPASLGGVLSRMKIQCHPNHRMVSGRRTETILCVKGEWYLSGRGYLKDNDVKCYPEDAMPVRPSP